MSEHSDAHWEVRRYVSSDGRCHAVLGGITRHPTDQDARQSAEHDLNLLRDYDRRRPYLVPDTCCMATVQSPGTHITGYLLGRMSLIDWDEALEVAACTAR